MAQRTERKTVPVWRIVVITFLSALLLFAVSFGSFLLYTLTPAYSLAWVHSVVQKNYYRELEKDFLSSASLDDLFGTDGALDAYSEYFTKREYSDYEQGQAGAHVGIGVSVQAVQNGEATFISRVAGNSPAEFAGLQEGMTVFGAGESESTVETLSYNGLSDFIGKMDVNKPFVLSAGVEGEVGFYTVCRSDYAENYVFYCDGGMSCSCTGEKALTPTCGESYLPEGFPDDTAYIRIRSFAGNCALQFGKMIQVFAERQKKNLILDLRSNGGGQVSVFARIAGYLCKEAQQERFPVGYAVYRGGRTDIFRASFNDYGDYFSADSRILVLANGGTASASEALLGAMLDYGSLSYGDVYLFGSQGEKSTYGKGIMQSIFRNVFTGEAVKLTTATVNWPISGRCIQGVGVVPDDGAVAVGVRETVELGDPALAYFVQNYLD